MPMTRRVPITAAAFGLLALAGCEQMPTLGQGGGQQLAMSDACGAAARQDLVGTSVGNLDAGSLPENRRVIFPGMAVTEDFAPGRLNVEVGPEDRITRVYCG
jgi:Peptidase inhibitor I78 family